MQLIQFKGRTVAVIAPEDLESLERDNAQLRSANDKRIEDFLAERICCSGHECGCMGVTRLDQIVQEEAGARMAALREAQWKEISTAPKSGWFLALRAAKYTSPTSCRVAVIHRVEGVGFGPWEGSEEAYYKADFFSHWMPFPELPTTG